MSIKGRPQRWFEQAIATGNLALALGEAAELRPLALGPALGLVCLLHEADDARAGRAAARWAAHLTLERPIDLHQLAEVVDALEHAATCPAGPRGPLAALAQQHNLAIARALAQRPR